MLPFHLTLPKPARLTSFFRIRSHSCLAPPSNTSLKSCSPGICHIRHVSSKTRLGAPPCSYSGARTEVTSNDGPTVQQDNSVDTASQTNTNLQSTTGSSQSPDAAGGDAAQPVNFTNEASVQDVKVNGVKEPDDVSAAAVDKPAKKKDKYQLLKRVMVGAVLGLFGAVVILTGKKMYLLAVSFIVYLATTEYFGFLTSKGISKGMTPPPKTVSIATTVLCISITIATYVLKGQYHGTTLSVAAVVLLACNILALRKPTFSMLVTSLFGLIYCGWLPSFWVRLRFVSTPLDNAEAWLPGLVSGWVNWTLGLAVTFTAVACVAAADIGAYFVGKNLGRTQLTEISPKKTVEGAIGGMLSSVAVAVALGQLTGWPPSPLIAAIFGVLVFCSSLCGDLVESVMKREAEMKDSGSLFPGHGGLLDRFDSYMFTGAVVYVFSIIVLPRFA